MMVRRSSSLLVLMTCFLCAKAASLESPAAKKKSIRDFGFQGFRPSFDFGNFFEISPFQGVEITKTEGNLKSKPGKGRIEERTSRSDEDGQSDGFGPGFVIPDFGAKFGSDFSSDFSSNFGSHFGFPEADYREEPRSPDLKSFNKEAARKISDNEGPKETEKESQSFSTFMDDLIKDVFDDDKPNRLFKSPGEEGKVEQRTIDGPKFSLSERRIVEEGPKARIPTSRLQARSRYQPLDVDMSDEGTNDDYSEGNFDYESSNDYDHQSQHDERAQRKPLIPLKTPFVPQKFNDYNFDEADYEDNDEEYGFSQPDFGSSNEEFRKNPRRPQLPRPLLPGIDDDTNGDSGFKFDHSFYFQKHLDDEEQQTLDEEHFQNPQALNEDEDFQDEHAESADIAGDNNLRDSELRSEGKFETTGFDFDHFIDFSDNNEAPAFKEEERVPELNNVFTAKKQQRARYPQSYGGARPYGYGLNDEREETYDEDSIPTYKRSKQGRAGVKSPIESEKKTNEFEDHDSDFDDFHWDRDPKKDVEVASLARSLSKDFDSPQTLGKNSENKRRSSRSRSRKAPRPNRIEQLSTITTSTSTTTTTTTTAPKTESGGPSMIPFGDWGQFRAPVTVTGFVPMTPSILTTPPTTTTTSRPTLRPTSPLGPLITRRPEQRSAYVYERPRYRAPIGGRLRPVGGKKRVLQPLNRRMDAGTRTVVRKVVRRVLDKQQQS